MKRIKLKHGYAICEDNVKPQTIDSLNNLVDAVVDKIREEKQKIHAITFETDIPEQRGS